VQNSLEIFYLIIFLTKVFYRISYNVTYYKLKGFQWVENVVKI